MFNDKVLRVLSGEKVSTPPVWLMRQAGRYMPEYMAIRKKVSFLELCKSPELAIEVTMQPVDILNVDAAILFSDILIPVEPMGINLEFNPAPVINNPVKTYKDANALKVIDPYKSTPFVHSIIKGLIEKLHVPLIGFSGAPFTLACYMVEGKGSKDFLEIKKLMYNDEKTYNMLMDKLTESTSKYLQSQIDCGCKIVQIFDTWAGILTQVEYREKVLPWVNELINSINGAYVIYFAKDGYHYFEDMKTLKCAAIGIDWKTPLERANKALGGKFVLQGNLDPSLLFTNINVIERHVCDILEQGKNAPGHIFNLGHGILPETPVENVKQLIKVIKGEL